MNVFYSLIFLDVFCSFLILLYGYNNISSEKYGYIVSEYRLKNILTGRPFEKYRLTIYGYIVCEIINR